MGSLKRQAGDRAVQDLELTVYNSGELRVGLIKKSSFKTIIFLCQNKIELFSDYLH